MNGCVGNSPIIPAMMRLKSFVVAMRSKKNPIEIFAREIDHRKIGCVIKFNFKPTGMSAGGILLM